MSLNEIERFEIRALAFYKMTVLLAPGKQADEALCSASLAVGDGDAGVQLDIKKASSRLRAALAKFSGEVSQ